MSTLITEQRKDIEDIALDITLKVLEEVGVVHAQNNRHELNRTDLKTAIDRLIVGGLPREKAKKA